MERTSEDGEGIEAHRWSLLPGNLQGVFHHQLDTECTGVVASYTHDHQAIPEVGAARIRPLLRHLPLHRRPEGMEDLGNLTTAYTRTFRQSQQYVI